MSFLTAIGVIPKSVVNDHPARPAARRIAERLRLRADDDAEALLAQAPDADRHVLINALASVDGASAMMQAWTERRPRSAMAQIALGASLISAGWEIRGGTYAEDVEESAWGPFLEHIERAERPLMAATRLDPASADAHPWLIFAALGRGAEQDELAALFSDAAARQPLHSPSHNAYLKATTDKWGGSHEAMFAFARSSSARAPRGHLNHALIAVAHNEHFLATAKATPKALRTPGNEQEIAVALQAWLDAPPSGWEPKLHRLRGAAAREALNHFAVAAYLCGAEAASRATLEALHGEIQSVPWAWLVAGLRERANFAFVHDRIAREVGLQPD